MATIYYKDPVTGDYIPVKTKTLDTLPVGTEVDFDGNEVPSGWEEVTGMSGSNANGTYIKFADGTMICYNSVQITASWNTITFPQNFISNPVVNTGINSGSSETSTITVIKIGSIGTNTFRACRCLSNGYDSGLIDYIAIGRWK